MANKSKILKFSKEQKHRITAINIVDGMLYFTDNNSEPKRIELDTFRNADHSSGNTNVFGRPFEERDITVIRPMPMVNLDVGIADEVVPIEATPPLLVTERAYPGKVSASITGRVTSAGVNIKTVGFYWMQKDTAPTEQEILTDGTYARGVTANGIFTQSISGLTKETTYWYIAVGFNGVNELKIARYGNSQGAAMIRSFTTKGDVYTNPGVDTHPPEKLTNEISKFRLKGHVSGNGGSNIVEVGFYVLKIKETEDQTKPSNLYNNDKAEKIGAIPILGQSPNGYAQFEVKSWANGFQMFWVQMYAINGAGKTGYGDVEGPNATDLVARPLPKIDILKGNFVELGSENALDTHLETQVKITYKPGEVREVGVYYSKIASDKDSILNRYANPEGERKVWKVEYQDLDPLTWADPFTVSENGNTEFSIKPGDKVHALAYIKCFIDGTSVTGYSDYNLTNTGFQAHTFTYAVKPTPVEDPPVVTTESFSQNEESDGVDSAFCRLFIEGNGVSGEPGPEISATENEVTSCGFIISHFTATEKIVMDGYSDAQKRAYILERLKTKNKTAEFIFKDSDGNNLVTQGFHEDHFIEDDAPIIFVNNEYYYGFAFATNETAKTPGYGKVLNFQFKGTDSAIEPAIGIRFAQDPHASARYANFGTFPANEIGIQFVMQVDRWVKGQDQVHDFGFVWQAASKDDFDFDASATAGRKASFVSASTDSATHYYSRYTNSSSRNNLNTILTTKDPSTNTSFNNLFQGLLLEASLFTDAVYDSDDDFPDFSQVYSAQPYVQLTSGGDYIKGTLVGPEYPNEVQDIREFRIREDLTETYAVPKLTLEVDKIGITKADVTATITEVTNLHGDEGFYPSITDVNLYYKPVATTAGATDAAKIADVVSTGWHIDHIDEGGMKNQMWNQGQWANGSYFQVWFGSMFIKYHSSGTTKYPELSPGTSYYMVATANNGSTSTSDISSLGAGVGYSNLIFLKTKPEPVTKIYWSNSYGQKWGTDDVYLFTGLLSEGGITRGATELHLLKAADTPLTNPSSSDILNDPDKITKNVLVGDHINKDAPSSMNNTGTMVRYIVNDLLASTAYWFTFSTVIPGEGTIYSAPKKLTTAARVNHSSYAFIKTPPYEPYTFNKGGSRLLPLQEELEMGYVAVDPSAGFFIPYSTTNTQGKIKAKVVTSYPDDAADLLIINFLEAKNGKTYIHASLDPGMPVTGLKRRWKVMLYMDNIPENVYHKFMFFEQVPSISDYAGGTSYPNTDEIIPIN